MALKLYNESDIQDIADAIRGKNGSSDTYTVSQMASAIDDIPTGGGGGSDETGSFVASGSQSSITIATTALHSHILLWDSAIKSDDNISSAPYGDKKTIFTYADGNTGFVIYGAISSTGTTYAGQFSPIGRWGGNTGWNDRVEFSETNIKIIHPRVNGVVNPWIDGHTINWRAW